MCLGTYMKIDITVYVWGEVGLKVYHVQILA